MDRESQRKVLMVDALAMSYTKYFKRDISRSFRAVANSIIGPSDIPWATIQKNHLSDVMKTMTRLYSVAGGIFSKLQFDSLRKDHRVLYITKDAESRFQYLLAQFIEEHGLNESKIISDTTIRELRQVLIEADKEGLTPVETAKLVSESSNPISLRRALTISLTETHAAAMWSSQTSTRETAKDLGLTTKKEWVAVSDERTRIDHQAANGQTVGINESFLVGGQSLRFPGDPNGSAGNVINCRCVETYSFED